MPGTSLSLITALWALSAAPSIRTSDSSGSDSEKVDELSDIRIQSEKNTGKQAK